MAKKKPTDFCQVFAADFKPVSNQYDISISCSEGDAILSFTGETCGVSPLDFSKDLKHYWKSIGNIRFVRAQWVDMLTSKHGDYHLGPNKSGKITVFERDSEPSLLTERELQVTCSALSELQDIFSHMSPEMFSRISPKMCENMFLGRRESLASLLIDMCDELAGALDYEENRQGNIDG